MDDKLTIKQKVCWDEKTNECALVTQFESGAILWQPITPEEAAVWQAANGY